MHPIIRRTLLLVLVTAALCTCGLRPHGALQNVMDGSIFEGTPRNPAEEKQKEESERQLDHQTPKPAETQGPVQFRIPF